MPGVLFDEGFGVVELFVAFMAIQPPDELFAGLELMFAFAELLFCLGGELHPAITTIPKIKIPNRMLI